MRELSLLERAVQEFPDYEPERGYEAALPLYRLRVVTRVLKKHSLSITARFVLRAIDLGCDTTSSIARLLGLEETDLGIAGGELLQAGLVEHGAVGPDGVRCLMVTQRGAQQIREARELLLPRQRTFHCHYDPLTGRVLPLVDGAASIDEVRKEGLFVIPAELRPPTVRDLDLTTLRDAVSGDERASDVEIVALLSLQKPYVEYLRGIQVCPLRHPLTGERRFAAFLGSYYLPTESEAIRSLGEQGVLIAPEESLDDESIDALFQELLSPETADAVEELRQRDERIAELERQLAIMAVARTATQDAGQRAEREEAERQQQEQIRRLSRDRDALEKRVRQISENGIEFVSTEAHRHWLERALQEAREEVIILSPWLNTRAVDGKLRSFFGAALKRGVEIWIGYGYGAERDAAERERNRESARAVIDALRQQARFARPELLHVVNMNGTHEKILICDRSFGIVGSFNWLSYRGDIDDGYRRETSTVIRLPQPLEKLATRTKEAFALAEGHFPARGRQPAGS